MSLTDMVLMPGADYQDICDAIRERTGGSELLKSGDIAMAIRGITSDESGDLGRKLYSFGILSDVHTSYGDGVEKLKTAMHILQNYGAEFIVCAGDLVNGASVSELQTHANTVDAVATVPFYSCNGNHDIGFGDEDWNTYVGHSLDYVLEQNGDIFVFFSLASATGYGEEKMKWLQGQFDTYKGRRIFLFMHYPLAGYSGLRPGTYYGFTDSSTEDDSIMSMMLSNKNVVQFSGHTHFAFGVEETYDDINAIELNFADCATIHIPSTNYPRTADNTAVYSGMSQGYMAVAYENGIVLRAVDFVAGAYMDGYEYILPIKNSAVEASSVIVVSATSLNVDEGGTTTFTVKLAQRPNEDVLLNLSTDTNNAITLDKTVMTFTPDNYNTEQTVTITAHEDDDSVDGCSVITLAGDGFTSKLISVTVADNDGDTPEPDNTLEWEAGYISSNGSFSDYNGFRTKAFNVVPGACYEIHVAQGIPGSSSAYVYFYNGTPGSETFLSRTALEKGITNAVTVPESAVYAIVRSNTLDASTGVTVDTIGEYIYLVNSQ